MTRISAGDNRIAVRTDYAYKEVCKSIPGARWDAVGKAWTYPATPSAARAIHLAFPGQATVWSEDAAALLLEAERIAEAAAHKTAEDLPDVPQMKTPAWQHQKRGFWFVVSVWGGLPK